MKIAILLACLLAFGPTLFGQAANSSIEGQVVNAATGAPLRKATVTLRMTRVVPLGPAQMATRLSSSTAQTDLQGRFAFRDLSPGGYQLIAQRQGFLDPLRRLTNLSGPGIMLGENQQLTGVVFRLTPHSVISGKVLDAEGEPVAGVQVAAFRWGYSNGKRQLTRATGGTSYSANDLGEYRITGLAGGSYFVIATPVPVSRPSYGPDQPLPEKPDVVDASTYYPSAIDAARAAPVRVAASAETRGIDIKLVQMRAVRIRGRVIDPGARLNSPAFVTLRPRGGADASMPAAMAFNSPLSGGNFLFAGVPPGAYYLVARRSEGQEPAGAVLPIEVADKDLDEITIQVSPGVEVQGAIKSEPPGRCVGGYITLSEESGTLSVPGTNISGGSKFILKSVVPATYTLSIPSPGTCYVQSLRFGGRDVAGMQVKIDGGGPLEITLAASESTVEGAVTDSAGRPLNPGTVTFLPKNGVLSDFRTFRTNGTGGFTALGLRPGEYGVFAWERVDYASAQSPEYVKQFESRGKSISIEAGGRQTLQLTAIPASATGEPAPMAEFPRAKGSIEGRVVHAVTGVPLSGVTVTLGTRPARPPGVAASGVVPGPVSQGQQSTPDSTVETDAQGHFAIRGIEPEVYYISAQGQGFNSPGSSDRPSMIGEPIVVGDGQRIAGYTLKLAPQSVIAGRVTDEFGEAVSNAQALLYRPEFLRGVRRLPRVAMAQTDDLGKFRFPGLAPGSYYLSVTKRVLARYPGPRPQPPADEPEMGYGMLWYPNASDAAGASPIVVGNGGDVPIDIVMQRTKVVRVRGTLLDAEGNPVPRPGMVGLTPRGLGTITTIGTVVLGRDGAFEIANVPAGSYLLSARASDGPPPRMAFLPVEVRDVNVEGIRLQLAPGREVRGALRLEGGGASSPIVMLSAPEGLSVSPSNVMPDGTFVLRSVWPLAYALNLTRLCENCYLKSVRYGGREVSEAAIDFTADGELEIVVSASAASLDGVALDRQGRPAAGAIVMLAPEDAPGQVLSGKTGARGSFHFGGLRPGAYRAYAWEGAAPEASPEALAPFQGQASTVKLQENAREEMQLATIKR